MAISVKEGDNIRIWVESYGRTGDDTKYAAFPRAMGRCVSSGSCDLWKAVMPTIDINCADAATSCAVGDTCSAGSMAQVSMSAVLFALCAALYQL
jgi:hypothetical protein